MKSVYLETTVISYLAAFSSRDLITAARQEITQQWWSGRRHDFELFVSQVVVTETSGGDAEAAQRRLAILEDLPLLDLTPEAEQLAAKLLVEGTLPSRAADDALHLAIAAVHGIDFLLTWNCKHLANAELIAVFEASFFEEGYESPIICTPDELMESFNA